MLSSRRLHVRYIDLQKATVPWSVSHLKPEQNRTGATWAPAPVSYIRIQLPSSQKIRPKRHARQPIAVEPNIMLASAACKLGKTDMRPIWPWSLYMYFSHSLATMPWNLQTSSLTCVHKHHAGCLTGAKSAQGFIKLAPRSVSLAPTHVWKSQFPARTPRSPVHAFFDLP